MACLYIVEGARTPIGKMSGALDSFGAAELGGFAIKTALGWKPPFSRRQGLEQTVASYRQQFS